MTTLKTIFQKCQFLKIRTWKDNSEKENLSNGSSGKKEKGKDNSEKEKSKQKDNSEKGKLNNDKSKK